MKNQHNLAAFHEADLKFAVKSETSFYENLGYELLAERYLDVGESQRLVYRPGKKKL